MLKCYFKLFQMFEIFTSLWEARSPASFSYTFSLFSQIKHKQNPSESVKF
ncbi:Uncharacterized protein dnm_023470 [Desulfonema magnum]|uniref:Uncharacterized protein n=1 Tax=Desulfonema magnum TaxID=45655 RepID=A0A975GM65_9BACT|nr:Uncharacterized protein dnm_023470 [Desulfonema magnum]